MQAAKEEKYLPIYFDSNYINYIDNNNDIDINNIKYDLSRPKLKRNQYVFINCNSDRDNEIIKKQLHIIKNTFGEKQINLNK
tara:strand:+ start:476 stop:721 length:246 start_codon:yes stop_codon:yes gene_type:complete